MRYAIYRLLYGEDFIKESIESIIDYVDKVFVFWDDTPWGDVTHVTYKGDILEFPKPIDGALARAMSLSSAKVHFIKDHVYSPRNQFTHLVNDMVLNWDRPEDIIILEADHVFVRGQLELALEHWGCGFARARIPQVELWRTPLWSIPDRGRTGAVLWDMTCFEKLPQTSTQGDTVLMAPLVGHVHNLGFCVSETAMYYKHLLALAFSKKIRDSIPNEDWYENKWLNWEPSMTNLEISKGHEADIPFAQPYPEIALPSSIRKRLHEWKVYDAVPR